MTTNFKGELSYRDYVVHVFTGIIFNVFLMLALFMSDSTPKVLTTEIPNQIIISIIAIPILFLEGHFILAIDRLLFIEIPSWYFRLKERKKAKRNNQIDYTMNENKDSSDQEHQCFN